MFRKLLSRIFRVFSEEDEVPASLSKTEVITRYLFQSNHVSSSRGEVKPRAFYPERVPGTTDLETSTFRTIGLAEEQIWSIGDQIRNKKTFARGDLRVSDVKEPLFVQPETSSHKLHAVIRGWPDTKDEWMSVAIELAQEASLKIR